MSKIKLLHSYLYIENTKNLKIRNNNIYENKNEFICGLTNIPSFNNNDGIKIILEKNLLKNKQSKKVVTTFYEKNNIKVYLEFDTKNSNILKHKERFLKLLRSHYINYVNIERKLFDCLCINKNFNRKLNQNYEIELNNQNNIQIYNLNVDFVNNSIKKLKVNMHIPKKINLNFSIIYSDYLLGTIKKILDNFCINYNTFNNSNNLNSILVVTPNNNIKLIWQNALKYDLDDFLQNLNSNSYSLNIISISEINKIKISNYSNIIVCDLDCKYFKQLYHYSCNKILYIYTNYENETIKDFLEKFYNIVTVNINYNIRENFNITQQTLYNYSKCIVYHNFYDKLVKEKSIKKVIIKTNEKINPLLKYIDFDIKDDLNNDINKDINNDIINDNKYKNKKNNLLQQCSICYDNFNEDEFIYLDCNHCFCRNCITKINEYNLSCCICRNNINKLKKTIYGDSMFDSNKWYYLGSTIKKIINEIKYYDNDCITYLEDDGLYPLINNIFSFYINKKFRLFTNKNNLDIVFKNKIKNNDTLKFIYVKDKQKNNSITCSNLCMKLKNYFENINLLQYEFCI